MTDFRYSEALWEKALRCSMVNNKPSLKRIFVEGLRSFIRYLMCIGWEEHNEATLPSMSYHATSLIELQEGSHSPAWKIRDDNRSLPMSPKSSLYPTIITTVMAIRQDKYSSCPHREAKRRREVVFLNVRIKRWRHRLLWYSSYHNNLLLSTGYSRMSSFSAFASQKHNKTRNTPFLRYR